MKALWLIVFASMFSIQSYAKKVSVDWKEMKRATQYEIQFEKDSKSVFAKKVKDPHWRGELEFGLYQYRIRAYDKLGRPGQWSKQTPLVVMPASPKPVYPDDDSKVTIYDSKSRINFTWENVPGVSSYRVTVLSGKNIKEEKTVTGNHALIGNLSPGSYQWRVAVVFENGDKKWNGPESEPQQFVLNKEKLKMPEPIEPLGLIKSSRERKYIIKWNPVEGAQAYRVRVVPTQNRGPASVNATEQEVVVKDTETEMQLPADGNYMWEVQALSDVSESGSATAKSGTAVASFNIVKGQDFRDGNGIIEISGLFANYTLEENSPAAGIRGVSAQTESAGYRILATYFPWENWGGGIAFTNHELFVNQQKYQISNLELNARYRMQFGDGYSPFYFYPKVGVEVRQYLMLLPQSSTFYNGSYNGSQLEKYSLTTVGPQIGFDIRKQFSHSFGASLQMQYYYPLGLLASDRSMSGLKTGAQSSKNLSVGAQGMYWFTSKLAVGAGLYFENRSVAFYRNEASPAAYGGDPETVSMSAKYLMMSLTYSFGQ